MPGRDADPNGTRETGDEAARWRRFARGFVGTAAGLAAGFLALAFAVDPYDSGRSGLLARGAVRPQGPRTANALRGRDPAYDGAILGNSHIQLVEPARLAGGTGIPFVQLSVPGTGPSEQLALLRWFLRHHPAPRALVLAADPLWCRDDPALPAIAPFPFWLYADGTAAYLRGLLRWPAAAEVAGRLGWLARGARTRARPDGWWDYEAESPPGDDPRRAAARAAPVPDGPDPGQGGPAFPAAARLADAAGALPSETALVLVFPPVYAAGLPRPGTPRAGAEAACRAALVTALAAHPRSAVVDGRRDRPALHDPGLFLDRTHYRHALARPLADEIAAEIRRLSAPAPPAKGAP